MLRFIVRKSFPQYGCKNVWFLLEKYFMLMNGIMYNDGHRTLRYFRLRPGRL